MSITIIVTLGPSLSSDYKCLSKINSLSPCIFRINGAHSGLRKIKELINNIREKISNAKIMIDLPGNKIRVSNLKKPINFKKGKKFILKSSMLNFPSFFQEFRIGDFVFANDSIYKFEITDLPGKDEVCLLPNSDGTLIRGKGLHILNKHSNLPFLFERDYDLLDLVIRENVDFISLSYVRSKADINKVKDYLASYKSATIIAKIETKAAVTNLDSILQEVDFIIVDRGDLSVEVGLMNIPPVQDVIIRKAKKTGTKIFLATQFLKNMENSPVPSIPEVFGVYDALVKGIHGIQLSEETAVGNYPLESVNYLVEAYQNLKNKV